MPDGQKTATHFQYRKLVRITAQLVFDTAWRIGSGEEGATASDLGVMLDATGAPILPGSSLKGKLRSTCETLSHALGASACLLNVEASGVSCVSDVHHYRQVRAEYQGILRQQSVEQRLAWIEDHTCDVCKLFGSPVMAGHLRVSDGALKDWANMVQVRDSVVIDRDSQTAVDGLKFDYDTVPADSRFELCIDLDNPSDQDLTLVGAALFEWHAGSSLGGFTSRGLGRFHLQDIRIHGVDLEDPVQRIRYLTHAAARDRLGDWGDWEAFFAGYIQGMVQGG